MVIPRTSTLGESSSPIHGCDGTKNRSFLQTLSATSCDNGYCNWVRGLAANARQMEKSVRGKSEMTTDQEMVLRMAAELLIDAKEARQATIATIRKTIETRLSTYWRQCDGVQGLRVSRAEAWLRLEKEQRDA